MHLLDSLDGGELRFEQPARAPASPRRQLTQRPTAHWEATVTYVKLTTTKMNREVQEGDEGTARRWDRVAQRRLDGEGWGQAPFDGGHDSAQHEYSRHEHFSVQKAI